MKIDRTFQIFVLSFVCSILLCAGILFEAPFWTGFSPNGSWTSFFAMHSQDVGSILGFAIGVPSTIAASIAVILLSRSANRLASDESFKNGLSTLSDASKGIADAHAHLNAKLCDLVVLIKEFERIVQVSDFNDRRGDEKYWKITVVPGRATDVVMRELDRCVGEIASSVEIIGKNNLSRRCWQKNFDKKKLLTHALYAESASISDIFAYSSISRAKTNLKNDNYRDIRIAEYISPVFSGDDNGSFTYVSFEKGGHLGLAGLAHLESGEIDDEYDGEFATLPSGEEIPIDEDNEYYLMAMPRSVKYWSAIFLRDISLLIPDQSDLKYCLADAFPHLAELVATQEAASIISMYAPSGNVPTEFVKYCGDFMEVHGGKVEKLFIEVY
jgi:hypothetical protein